ASVCYQHDRGPNSDEGEFAVLCKSEKRQELEAEGHWITGSSGDERSDLLGHAIARRSFKLPESNALHCMK
ncbi:hypothetical protein Ancab_028516, partial [Ancistrocladus abbreviatus]